MLLFNSFLILFESSLGKISFTGKFSKNYFNNINDELINLDDTYSASICSIIESTDYNLDVQKEADENNQLYGSISKKEIINFLKEKEIKIPADDIKITLPIRSLGEHQIEINPYEGIVEYINISVNKN